MPDVWVHCKECDTLVLTYSEFDPDSSSTIQIIDCPNCGRKERYDPTQLDWQPLPPTPEEPSDE